MESGGGFPAGWYEDPSRRYRLRYWDGVAWTEHAVSDAGGEYSDPFDPRFLAARPQVGEREDGPGDGSVPEWARSVVMVLGGVAIVALVGLAGYLVASGSGRDASPASAANGVSASRGSAVPTTVAPTTSAPHVSDPAATQPPVGIGSAGAPPTSVAAPAAAPAAAAPPAVAVPMPTVTTLAPGDLAAVKAWWNTLYFGGLGIAEVYIGLGNRFECNVFAGGQPPETDDQKTVVADLDDLRSKLAAAPTVRTQQLATAVLESLRRGLDQCVEQAPPAQLAAASDAVITAKETLQDYLLSL
jgi:hypothetical protein